MKTWIVSVCVLLAAFHVSGEGLRLSAGVEFGWQPSVKENQTAKDTGISIMASFLSAIARASHR